MSEKILVDRDLMKRLFDIIAGDGFHEELEVDKLLSATPTIKAGRLALDSYSDRDVNELSERNDALEFQASHNYEVAQLLLAQCDQLRDELYALKAGQGEADDHAALEAERDELRAQVEAMRALMAEAVPALQHISDTAQDLESFTLAERFRLALQAKP